MAIRRRSVNTWVKLLKKSDDYYFFKLGSKPLKAAKLIQKNVRKFLFRQKMRRILDTYKKIRQQKVVQIKNCIRKYIRIFLGKKVISDLKFFNYRAERLIKIRQRLCILLMKAFWRKNKFTFKIVMTRIKKYKRMKKNEERMKASKANLLQGKAEAGKKNGGLLGAGLGGTGYQSSRSSFYDDSELGSGDEEGKEVKEDVGSCTSEINKKLEAERQGKIAIAKVAYSIPKNKEPINVLPYLYQKDILEGVSPPSHHITTTRASVFRMNDSNPRRQNPSILSSHSSDPTKLAQIKPQTSATTRPKHGQDGNPLYMKPTTAYKMSRWDAEAPGEDVEEPKKNIKPRDNSKVLSGTFTSMQKVSKVYKNKDNFKVWRPNTRHQELYVTNIDNFHFAPPVKQKKRPQTMSYSPRGKIERGVNEQVQVVEARIEVNTLTFDAALPGLASIVNCYKGGFKNNVRPGTEKMRRLSSIK